MLMAQHLRRHRQQLQSQNSITSTFGDGHHFYQATKQLSSAPFRCSPSLVQGNPAKHPSQASSPLFAGDWGVRGRMRGGCRREAEPLGSETKCCGAWCTRGIKQAREILAGNRNQRIELQLTSQPQYIT